MNGWRILAIILIVLGVVFVAVGISYLVMRAGSLPSFLPGHIAGSMAKHTRRGTAALIVGILCLVGAVGAWIVSARGARSSIGW
jgi:hypothetical protein